MRILDLGCGWETNLAFWGINASDAIIGIDLDHHRLAAARVRFPNRRFLRGAGETLPFAEDSFDRVVSGVALPYMNIPKALAEIHRVLVSGGSVSLSLHTLRFTLDELFRKALPRPRPTLFRLYVMANGIVFHLTGGTAQYVKGRTESFQTERGMRIALERAGFVDHSFRRKPGPFGEILIADARNQKS
jgi:ubiquinone/menaquinone biosynthesis C-methylase UbiE